MLARVGALDTAGPPFDEIAAEVKSRHAGGGAALRLSSAYESGAATMEAVEHLLDG